jgi:betaine reductase
MVKAGVYKSVAIVAGGATAKLGMNARDHVNKGVPILEDCLGGFAILVTENDFVSPILRTDIVGRHTVGTGSSPQAVMEALITKPLDKVGLKITDVDKYSVEMQNPEITEPAGAGDVPLANFKMIAALGAKRGDIDKTFMPAFIKEHGMPGFAPTQGHIPSGVPFVGAAREMMMSGVIERAMIVGKGSLFLGRMTNQFDGVSIIMERNTGKEEAVGTVSKEEVKGMVAEAMKDFASFLLDRK